jgi:hypothetical protein
MTDAEFRTLVSRLRAQQRRFFAAKPGMDERLEALSGSKKFEKQIDSHLANYNERSLFAEEIA